jgi:hypothetical protein
MKCKNDSEPAGEQMTLFSLAGSLNYASHIQPPESGLERKTSDTCGPKCAESFGRFNHVGLWAKTFSALLIGTGDWYSTRCKLTWKLKGTKYNRLYFQLQASTLPTNGTEFGLLLTPTTREEVVDLDKFKKRMEKYPNGTTMPNLATQVIGLLPTPRARAAGGNCSNDRGKGNLEDKIAEINTSQTGTTSQLNPRFVLEMMGFPPNWTELPFLNGETNQSKPPETPLCPK